MKHWETVRFLITILMAGALTTSCIRHFYNVSWNGIVVDEHTNLPVQGCEVSANCFMQGNMDQSQIITYNSKTDIFGSFNIELEKGYKIKSHFYAPGFQKLDLGGQLNPGNLPNVIKLKRLTDDNRYGNLEVRPIDHEEISNNTPFVGIQFLELDSATQRFTCLIGFDLLNGCKVASEDSADLWIEFSRSKGFLPLVCSNKNGGIYIPGISGDAVTDSLIQDHAPLDGYQTYFRFTGKENQLFVKCRDGIHFAKIILDDHLCVLQYQDKANRYREMGLRFSYAVQRDMDQPRFFPGKLISEMTESLSHTVRLQHQ